MVCRLVALLLVLVCSKGVCTGVPATVSGSNGGLLPGAVTDEGQTTIFTNGEDGSTMAVDFRSGSVLWSVRRKLRPLLVFHNFLLTVEQDADPANVVRLVWLDIERRGRITRTSDPIVLPEWVSVVPARGRSILVEGRIEEGKPVFLWEARAFYAGGARPTSEVLTRAEREAAGLARLDPATGRILGEYSRSPGEEMGSPKLPASLAALESAPYWTGSAWSRKPLLLDGYLMTLDRSSNGAGQTLTLVTQHLVTGQVERVDLGTGKSLFPMVSGERSHLFVHDSAAEAGPRRPAWTAYSLPRGRLTASLTRPPGTLAAAVVGSLVVVLEEDRRARPAGPGQSMLSRSLKALELETGEMIWSLSIQPRLQWNPAR